MVDDTGKTIIGVSHSARAREQTSSEPSCLNRVTETFGKLAEQGLGGWGAILAEVSLVSSATRSEAGGCFAPPKLWVPMLFHAIRPQRSKQTGCRLCGTALNFVPR